MMQRLLRGVGALLVLAVLIIGAPLVLIAWIGNPWPPGGWAEVQLLTNRTLYGVVAVVGWLAWAQMTACVLVEIGATIKGIKERGVVDVVDRGTGAAPVMFATGGQQNLARTLVVWVAALGIGAGTVATASAASPGADLAIGHLTSRAPISQTVQLPAEADETKQGRSTTASDPTTLWQLAETHLGAGSKWQQLLKLNRGTTMADGTVLTNGTQTIPAGTTIMLPSGADSDSTRIVQDDEYLSLIAKEEMGDGNRWQELYGANRDVIGDNPDLIHPGMRLTIPGGGVGGVGGPDADTPATHEAPKHPKPQQQPDQQPEQQPPPQQEQQPPKAGPTSPAETVPETEPDTAPPTSTQVDNQEQSAEADEDSLLDAPWVLAGLTGGGVLLAGALFIGLQQRRRAKIRERRPGRGIAVPPPELAPVEMTINAAGGKTAATVEFMDAALKRVAAAAHANHTPMPALAAVELKDDRLTLHLSGPTELPDPWQGTLDRAHWHCTTDVDPDQLGPEPEHVEAPYPLLVTLGKGTDGSIWLLNCEELGTLAVTGDPQRSRDFARHIAAQVAVNPWSRAVQVDCVGLAAEAEPLGERIRFHTPGADASTATAEVLADAVSMTDRATGHDTDVSTGRTGQIDDDVWPARMLMMDALEGVPERVHDLIKHVDDQRGRTATSIVITGHLDTDSGWEVKVTAAGRVILETVGLDLAGVGLTSDETRGCALLYAQTESATDVAVPVDEDAEGWEAYVDRAGSLRREYTVPRTTRDEDLEEPAGSLLDGDDEEYLQVSATTREDLEALAPKVPAHVRAEVEEKDPTLDQDVADWFDRDSQRPRLSLLGDVEAHTHGTALAKRKAYFTELLAFLALRRKHGVTTEEVCDAFGISPSKAREYVRVVRDWLGENPRNGEPYLPHADKAPAAQRRGVNVYQIDEELGIDLDLFRRLRKRGEARGGDDGLADLSTALELVDGRPFGKLRAGGWAWLAEGHRHDLEMTGAIADVALVVTVACLKKGDLSGARAATELAILAAPYEEATRLSLVQITDTEGNRQEAERILRDEICNRSDDGDVPPELNERTKTIIGDKEWLAS